MMLTGVPVPSFAYTHRAPPTQQTASGIQNREVVGSSHCCCFGWNGPHPAIPLERHSTSATRITPITIYTSHMPVSDKQQQHLACM